MIVTVWLTPNIEPTFRAPFVLIPLIPPAFALRAYLRFLGRMDELGRRIRLEALAFGFGAAGMLTFALGGAIATRRYQ